LFTRRVTIRDMPEGIGRIANALHEIKPAP